MGAETGETQIWVHIFMNSLDFLSEAYLSVVLQAVILFCISGQFKYWPTYRVASN